MDVVLAAKSTLSVAVYEIDRPDIVDAIVDAASRGVDVRVIVDNAERLKDVLTESDKVERAFAQRLMLEHLVRGRDGQYGTADDASVAAESPVEAVEAAPRVRTRYRLPPTPSDLPRAVWWSGDVVIDAPVVARGFARLATENGTGRYRAPSTSRMHHKFMVADGEVVHIGSYNYTTSGAFGSVFDERSGRVLGHRQAALRIKSKSVASAFAREFDRLWDGNQQVVDAEVTPRAERTTGGSFSTEECGFRIEGFFLPSDGAPVRERIAERLASAQRSISFEMFAFTDPVLAGSIFRVAKDHSVAVHGIVDARFYKSFLGAAEEVSLEARKFFEDLEGLDGTRAVQVSKLYRKLHSKFAIVDGLSGEGTSPSVIFGSANWSASGFERNFESVVILNDPALAARFQTEFLRFYRLNLRARDSIGLGPVRQRSETVAAVDKPPSLQAATRPARSISSPAQALSSPR
ncbi:MAG: phospholipase D-like domain-containing protein [Myxococcota bacterium]